MWGVIDVDKADEYVVALKYVNDNGVRGGKGVGKLVTNGEGMGECFSHICDGFARLVVFMVGKMCIPHIVKREP
jgi:hypothetical protein